ncbi:UDP-3-O-(3-hydroxymyristoyl)glucosamine N-acyltransferase [Candidatus Bandiella euplotis]|uniref:UDP-3-O-acylglucosamine N-acyltransferase n=1 Tax=Candidatus Bandiella euplotis TaxID=1664265 RepID=A0ABZ0UJY5_9RICK|nr:UDP-3-O-(3-hydroxymyristoyl)glucosamine N-acyltransferase [Candidatus Bandiella woodruffii]WPX96426.1 UDP-3-O-acylglucosamine N-acyltransferase [Candidatus Bandiella woodruffii]
MQKDFFYEKSGPFQLGQLIEEINIDAEILGDSSLMVSGVSTLIAAKKSEVAFFYNVKYTEDLRSTKAGVCILKEEHKEYAPKNITLVVMQNPRLLYALLIEKFYPQRKSESYISELAVVKPSARVGSNCVILEGVIIGKNSIIGDGVFIGCNTVIGDGVRIGDNTRIDTNVTVVYAMIGSGCHIYSGVRIGQDGFGFIPGGPKIRHVGIVEIGNNVEIGANTCIDKGTLENTVIKDNCKIDNLVQIGHNVEIGRGTIIAAQTGISGSTKIGENVMLGGQTGIAGHLKVGDKAMAAGKSGIINDIEAGGVVAGYPAIKINDWHRQNIFLKKQIKKSEV